MHSFEFRHSGITVKLPVGPSVNQSYHPGRRKSGKSMLFRSRRYVDWRNLAVAMILAPSQENQIPSIDKVPTGIIVSASILYNRDLDNILKGTFDALTHARKLADDRWISDISAIRVPVGWGGLEKNEMYVSLFRCEVEENMEIADIKLSYDIAAMI